MCLRSWLELDGDGDVAVGPACEERKEERKEKQQRKRGRSAAAASREPARVSLGWLLIRWLGQVPLASFFLYTNFILFFLF
jgi:hypothetical protein